MDWNRLENEATDLVVAAVRRVVGESPAHRLIAAALHGVYREELGVIGLPSLAVQTAAAYTPAGPRLDANPCDWQHDIEDWCPRPWGRQWQDDLVAEAGAWSPTRWHATFDRYLAGLVHVCNSARTDLNAAYGPDRSFVVFVVDDERQESLLRNCLTESQLNQHFPALVERATALAQASKLPKAARARYFARRLSSFDGPITSEDAQTELRKLGPASYAVLFDLLDVDGQAWLAAKLLADIGRPDRRVVRRLRAALLTLGTDSDRTWVACALSRLQRFDLVLADVDRIPSETIAAAITAPLKRFRDHTANPPPLTYRHIENFLDRHPEYSEAVASELAPGTAFCEIAATEVDEALRGLAAAHPVIRCHAAAVLGDRRLGPQTAARSLPALVNARHQDPDRGVQHMAELSIAALQPFAQ